MEPTDRELVMANNHGALGISNVFQALKNVLPILSSFAILKAKEQHIQECRIYSDAHWVLFYLLFHTVLPLT